MRKFFSVALALALVSTMAIALAVSAYVSYDETGSAKYTIFKLNDGHSYRVFSQNATEGTWAANATKYLFDYVQSAAKFEWIGYSDHPSDMSDIGDAVGFTYDGKLIYPGADNKLGTADDKDLTAAVAACNAYFNFDFSNNNPATDKSFTERTPGNSINTPATYDTTTAVRDPDDADVAPTDDGSAGILLVMAAAVALAAAAFVLVFKKT